MKKEEPAKERTYKVRTPYNYIPSEGKKFTQKSQTVPDMAIPLAVLLDRHTRGVPVDLAAKIPLYDEEETSIGINGKTLDLVDLQELREANKQTILDLKQELKNAKANKQKEPLIQKTGSTSEPLPTSGTIEPSSGS